MRLRWLSKLSHTKKNHKKTPWPQGFCWSQKITGDSRHGPGALHGAISWAAQVSATFHCGHGHRFGVLDGDVELHVG